MSNVSQSRRRTSGLSMLVVASATVLISSSGVYGAYSRIFNADSASVSPDPGTPAGGGWTVGGTAAGTVQKTAGAEGGHNFWQVLDTNTSTTSGNPSNNSVIYNVNNTIDPSLTAAMSAGWQFTTRLKVAGSANPTLTPPAYNVPTWIDIRDGRRIYTIAFVNDGVNEGIYRATQTGSTFTADPSTLIKALDLDVFHTVTMLMVSDGVDHSKDAISIYIDGNLEYTLNTSNTQTTVTMPRVQWGSGLAAATQNVSWQYVAFMDTPIISPFGPGDANGDGVVNADDYALIDRGFAGQKTGWQNGDFNYDGLINSADYLAIDTAYAQSHPLDPELLAARSAAFGDGYASALAAAVPEPTTLGLCGVVATMVVGRRRRFA